MVILVIDIQTLITNEKLYNFKEFVENVETLISSARKNNIEVNKKVVDTSLEKVYVTNHNNQRDY